MGGAATQTGRLGTAADTAGGEVDATRQKGQGRRGPHGRVRRKTAAARGRRAAGGACSTLGGVARRARAARVAVNLGEQFEQNALVVFRGSGAP